MTVSSTPFENTCREATTWLHLAFVGLALLLVIAFRGRASCMHCCHQLPLPGSSSSRQIRRRPRRLSRVQRMLIVASDSLNPKLICNSVFHSSSLTCSHPCGISYARSLRRLPASPSSRITKGSNRRTSGVKRRRAAAAASRTSCCWWVDKSRSLGLRCERFVSPTVPTRRPSKTLFARGADAFVLLLPRP